MGWERRRRGGRYYTRSRKVGGRVFRTYVGAGGKGEAAAAEDARRRAERQALTDAVRDDRARWQAAERPLDDLDELAGLLTHALLYAGGYHQHARGEWRRRREEG